MKIQIEDCIIDVCNVSYINEILSIQLEAFAEPLEADILRYNSKQILMNCLKPPHYTLGAWYKEKLIAFSILYIPQEGDEEENLSLCLENVGINGLKTANYKLCIVRKEYRGNSLQYNLGIKLESYAAEQGIKLICATVSPKNRFSINNFVRMNYVYNRKLIKYGFERCLYSKLI